MGTPSIISRRAVLGAAFAASLPRSAAASPAKPIIINALGNLWDPNISLGAKASVRPAGKVLEVDDRVIDEARRAGLSAINITVGYVAGPGDPYELTNSSLARWDALIKANSVDLVQVLRSPHLYRAKAENKIGLIYGFQNSMQVGADLDRVAEFAARGVRVVQLTYNDQNLMGAGSAAPEGLPLTRLGAALVERLNACRIMVDLSHSNRQTCLDALQVSQQPVSINHTGCRALADLPRNKTDEELRQVALKGGFVGIFFMPYLRADGRAKAADVVAHIKHALNVCGEDHVGVGTDGTPTAIDDLQAFRLANGKDYAERAARGVATKGESPDNLPFIAELTGPGQFAVVAQKLRAEGVRQRIVDKILGSNFADFAERVWE